jgi:glycosyltransferase involved in cell wall biosynthesis
MGSGQRLEEREALRATEVDVLLSVVVPAYNQAGSIAESLATIRDAISAGLDGAHELIVVSDGSIDETVEHALEEADENLRIIHYERNLGKGYAVKLGALEARGRYIAFIDADLDLHPSSLPEYVDRIEGGELDFVIGSKRHPASQVHYPRSRRFASACYQLLVWSLFQLDVRDTQVGLKVLRREVAEQVMPLLLVKRFAFDLELLAVSRALGFRRIEEQPVRLDYRFTGSGVRSIAVLRALIDTAAIFYRLRVLRYYQRKQALVGRFGWNRLRAARPLVTVVRPSPDVELDYPDVETIEVTELTAESVWDAASRAKGDVLAVLEPGARPTSNWLSATTPFLGREDIVGVVVPKTAPHVGSARQRAAAGVCESRLGGSQYFGFTPGNVRFVRDFPTASLVLSRRALLELGGPCPLEEVVARLAERGGRVLYTPETVLAQRPPALFQPHLARVLSRGRARGSALRVRGPRSARPSSFAPLAFLGVLTAGVLAVPAGGAAALVWTAVTATYAVAVLAAGTAVALRFRSPSAGALAVAGVVATHVTYAAGFVAGLFRR